MRDFAPVSLLAQSPFLLLAAAALGAADLRGLVALAKARPGALNYASFGNGTSNHFVGELFKERVISERVMQECVQSLISVVEARPAEEEVERLCALLAAGGPSLRSTKALADVFSRLKALQGRAGVGNRAGFMLLVRC